jgi:hypothetical protein
MTRSDTVLPQQTGVAFFSPAQLQLNDGDLVYLVDSIGNQISNALIWSPNKNSGSEPQQPTKMFVKENGAEIPLSEFKEIESVIKISPSKYILNINSSKPFYVYFSESYSDNWKMHIGQTEMKHYRPPFGNLFFVDNTGDLTITMTYENSEVYYIHFGTAIFAATLALAILQGIIPRDIKNKMMDRLMQRCRSAQHLLPRGVLTKERRVDGD